MLFVLDHLFLCLFTYLFTYFSIYSFIYLFTRSESPASKFPATTKDTQDLLPWNALSSPPCHGGSEKQLP